MSYDPPEQPTSGNGAMSGLLIGWAIAGMFMPESWYAPGDSSFIIALIVLGILGLVFGDQVEREMRDMPK